jgi:hypothetical protein
MTKFHIGDELMLKPQTFSEGDDLRNKPLMRGKVIYINEKHLLFTAEFKLPCGQTFNESFNIQDLEGK